MKKLLLAFFLLVSSAGAGEPLFEDNFDFFDDKKWAAEDGVVRLDAINSKSCVRVENGRLILSARTIEGKHLVGFVSSQDKVQFGLGYMEIAARFTGLDAGYIDWWLLCEQIFTNKIDQFHSPSKPMEIDIVEYRKRDVNYKDLSGGLFRCLHWNYYYPDLEKNCEGIFTDNLNMNDGKFHKFGFYRDRGVFMFTVDGYLISVSTITTDLPMYMIFSVEILNGGWAGFIPESGYNQDCLEVEYMRYWANP